jgi:hypothetical protein
MIIWSGVPLFVNLLTQFMLLLEIGFSLGLVFGLVALIISLPLLIWFGYTRSS